VSVASFDSAGFDELGQDSVYNIWSKSGIAITKKIPGGDKNVIQKIGVDLPRLAMPIKATASQITALYGKVGGSGTLVFSYETCTARLESMEQPQSIGIGNNLYTSQLNLIRLVSVGTPTTGFITEVGETFITEGGDTLIEE
jgi:hypothetical protein